jgi:hypothetical protein
MHACVCVFEHVMALSSIGASTKASSSEYIGVCMHECMCVCLNTKASLSRYIGDGVYACVCMCA